MPIWGICTADIIIYHYLHGFIISSTRGQDSSTPIVTGALICSHFQVFSAPNSKKPEVSVNHAGREAEPDLELFTFGGSLNR